MHFFPKAFRSKENLMRNSGFTKFVAFQTLFLTYFCHNTKRMCWPRSQCKTRRHIPLGKANINTNAYFRDNGLSGCYAGWLDWSLQTWQPAEHKNCVNPKFRSCYFSNLTRLDDRGDAVFMFEHWISILVYILYMFFCTFQHIWRGRVAQSV